MLKKFIEYIFFEDLEKELVIDDLYDDVVLELYHHYKSFDIDPLIVRTKIK